LAVLLAPPLLYFAGGAAGLTQEAALFVGILATTVLMWLFGLADEFVPPLLAITAVLMVGLVPSDIALGGFSSRTLTTLMGVYALASLIGASGLSYRVMTWLLIRLPRHVVLAADRAAAVGLCAVAHHALGQRPPVAAAAAVPRHGQRPEPQAAGRGGRGADGGDVFRRDAVLADAAHQ
jgi:hypothetical protein